MPSLRANSVGQEDRRSSSTRDRSKLFVVWRLQCRLRASCRRSCRLATAMTALYSASYCTRSASVHVRDFRAPRPSPQSLRSRRDRSKSCRCFSCTSPRIAASRPFNPNVWRGLVIDLVGVKADQLGGGTRALDDLCRRRRFAPPIAHRFVGRIAAIQRPPATHDGATREASLFAERDQPLVVLPFVVLDATWYAGRTAQR